MLGNPIVFHEMRRSASTKWCYARRAVLVLILALVVWSAWPGEGDLSSAVAISEKGRETFLLFYGFAAGLTFLLVPGLMGDLIAGERERKTLELLFATPLTARQIVWGKFISQYGYYLHAMTMTAPIVLVSLILGGIDTEEVATGLGLILSFGFFVGALTFFFSTVFRKGGIAILWTILGLILYSIFTSVLFASVMFRSGNEYWWWLALNPMLIMMTWTTPVPFIPDWLHPAICCEYIVLGVALLIWAQRRVSRMISKEDRPREVRTNGPLHLRVSPLPQRSLTESAAVSAREGSLWADQFGGSLGARQEPPQKVGIAREPDRAGQSGRPASNRGQVSDVEGRVSSTRWIVVSTESLGHAWNNPVAWRETKGRVGRSARWLVLLSVVGYFLILLVPLCAGAGRGGIGADDFCKIALVLTGTLGLGLLWLVLGCVAAMAIVSEKERGTLELLLITPLRRCSIVWGKVRGILRAARLLIVVFFSVGILALLGAQSSKHPMLLSGMLLGVLPAVALFTLVTVLLGLLFSCICRSVSRALGMTIFTLVACCMLLPLMAELLSANRVCDTFTCRVVSIGSPFGVVAELAERATWGGRYYYSSSNKYNETAVAFYYGLYGVLSVCLLYLLLARFERLMRKRGS